MQVQIKKILIQIPYFTFMKSDVNFARFENRMKTWQYQALMYSYNTVFSDLAFSWGLLIKLK